MTLSAPQRWTLYAVALALILGATAWVEHDADDAAVVATARAEAPAPAADAPRDEQSVQAFDIGGLPVRKHAEADGDPFSPRSWKQMAAQEAARNAPRLPPPPPQAPPLPFTYMGKMVEGKTVTVFLTDEERNYIARVGETLEGTYRVEEIGEHGIVLTYLPLRQRQTLAFDDNAPRSGGPRLARAALPGGDDEDLLERTNVDLAPHPSRVQRAPHPNDE